MTLNIWWCSNRCLRNHYWSVKNAIIWWKRLISNYTINSKLLKILDFNYGTVFAVYSYSNLINRRWYKWSMKMFSVLCGLFFFLLWIIPIIAISISDRTNGGEKFAWILAVIFVSWFAWVFYLLLAPLKSGRYSG